MKKSIAIYPGTFDPFTKGHEDLVLRATRMWSKVIVAVAAAYHKKPLFTLEERLEITKNYFAGNPDVEVKSFDGLLRDFVRQQKASVVVRGVRAVSDFEYEFQLAAMNQNLMPEVDTVFLTPCTKFHFVSSTLIREIGLLEGEINQFVSEDVAQRLAEKKAICKLKK